MTQLKVFLASITLDVATFAVAIGIPLAILGVLLKSFGHAADLKRGKLDVLAKVTERDFQDPSPETILFLEEALRHYFGARISHSIYQILRMAPDRSRSFGYWKRVFSIFEPTADGLMLQYVRGGWVTHKRSLKRISVGLWIFAKVVGGTVLVYLGLFLVAVAWIAYDLAMPLGFTATCLAIGIPAIAFGILFFNRGLNVVFYHSDFVRAVGPLLVTAEIKRKP